MLYTTSVQKAALISHALPVNGAGPLFKFWHGAMPKPRPHPAPFSCHHQTHTFSSSSSLLFYNLLPRDVLKCRKLILSHIGVVEEEAEEDLASLPWDLPRTVNLVAAL
jgi:hypothetical protein